MSSDARLDDFEYVPTTTRSVRRRLDLTRPVDPQVILDCIDIAVQAPTGGAIEGWRWMVVTDEEQRARVAEAYRKGRAHRERRKDTAPDERTRRVYDNADLLFDVIDKAPVLVIPCVHGRVDQDLLDYSGSSSMAAAALYGSIIPAAWSFVLALRSRGLGTCWTALHLLHELEVVDALGIPDGVTQAALFPVAYTTGLDFKPARRAPAREVTYWDRWGTPPPS